MWSARRTRFRRDARDLAEDPHREARARGTAAARRTRRRARAPCRPARTSSLNSCRSGSTSLNRIRSGRPPTLWWLLITCDGPMTDTLSITSGYSVPWPRKSNEPSFCASASNTSMNAAPMILRFCSGSVMPASRSRNSVDGVDEHERQLQPLEAARGSAPPRPAASRRCRRRCRSGDRRSRGGSAPPRRSNRRRRSGRRRRARRRPARGSARSPPRRTTTSSSRRCSRRRRTRSCAGCRGRDPCARPRDGTAARTAARSAAAIAATGALALVAVTANPAAPS